MHEIGLVNDFTLVLLCAALVSLVFSKLQWPVFLGYIASGLLVGPNLFAASPISDIHNIEQLAQLGIIFLMFYIGMEFDLKRMRQVLLPSLSAVVLQTALFVFIGLQIAPLFKQGSLFGLFLGCLLAISSSMVTISILRDLKSLDTPHGQMAVGILIFEDILAITMLVVLSGVAVSSVVSFMAIAKVAFLILVFVVGIYYLGKLLSPKVINFLDRQGSEELITLSAVAFVLAVSLLAVKFHFSEALGAFLAGSILSQSKLIKKIEHAVEPLRNVFTAVFFVSIGILIQPRLIVDIWPAIVGMGLMVVVVKIASVWLGLVLVGQKTDTSFRAAVVKAQIGEFSFIIVALAINLKVADPSFMTIAVGVSVLSAILSQLLASNVEPLIEHTAKRLPRLLVTFHRYYETLFEGLQLRLSRNELLALIRRPLLAIIFYIILMTGLMITAYFLVDFAGNVPRYAAYSGWLSLAIWLLAAIALLPFGSAIVRNIDDLVVMVTEAAFANIDILKQIERRFLRLLHAVVSVAVITLVAAFYFSLAASYMPQGTALVAFLLVSLGALLFFWQRIRRLDSRIETFFMKSFEEQLTLEEVERHRQVSEIARRYPWPVHINEVEIGVDSMACGLKIGELNIRGLTGATIIGVSRHSYVHYNPSADTMIFPFDQLFLFGEKEQVNAARRLFAQEKGKADSDLGTSAEVKIDTIYVGHDCELNKKNLAGANLRKRYGITVLGIQRGEQQITSPPPYFIIEPGDILHVIGKTGAFCELTGACREQATDSDALPLADNALSPEKS
ncbi:MAG: cation:proton antiporter [Proteobacteria bacterium]|nr:cation:proton antiporter [Pseudomonadota bacterium]